MPKKGEDELLNLFDTSYVSCSPEDAQTWGFWYSSWWSKYIWLAAVITKCMYPLACQGLISWQTGNVCERCGFDVLRNVRSSVLSSSFLIYWGVKKRVRQQEKTSVPFSLGLLQAVGYVCYHCIETHLLQTVNIIGRLVWSQSLKIKRRL